MSSDVGSGRLDIAIGCKGAYHSGVELIGDGELIHVNYPGCNGHRIYPIQPLTRCSKNITRVLAMAVMYSR